MNQELTWHLGPDARLTLDHARVIGVLNVTPDSFSDGGRYTSVAAAVGRGLRMLAEGTDVIDVGGESARPGATRVSVEEQIARTCPVIEGLRRDTPVPISIDTTRVEVAAAALDAGASIINDISAATEDEGMLDLAAKRQCGLVLMHRLRPPDEDSYSDRYAEPPTYDDVTTTVRTFLEERVDAAIRAGVTPNAIVIDPGLGFGKTVAQNFELIARTRELVDTGLIVLSAASRKSFLGAVTGVEQPSGRAVSSTAVSVVHWLAGVRLFRVHDVAAHRETLAVVEAISAPAPAPVGYGPGVC